MSRKPITRTRTSSAFYQMIDDVPTLITMHGHINECCNCGARHRFDYDPDGNGAMWWWTKLIRKGRAVKP